MHKAMSTSKAFLSASALARSLPAFPAKASHRNPSTPRSERLICKASAGSRGVAVLHLYEDLRKPAFFDNFLEGLTHVAEVARHHPNFKTANIHTCLDQEALDKGAAYSYFTLSTFCADDSVRTLEDLAEHHPDWTTSMEFGHEGQVHHPIVMREFAKVPDNMKTAVEQGLEGAFSCRQDDVVVMAAAKTDFPDESWQHWSGVDCLKSRIYTSAGACMSTHACSPEDLVLACDHCAAPAQEDFRSATFYKTADSSSEFCQIVRVELDNVKAVDLDSLASQVQDADEASASDVIIVVYRSLIHVGKGGSPVDLLFANRAKEENA